MVERRDRDRRSRSGRRLERHPARPVHGGTATEAATVPVAERSPDRAAHRLRLADPGDRDRSVRHGDPGRSRLARKPGTCLDPDPELDGWLGVVLDVAAHLAGTLDRVQPGYEVQ